MGDLFEKLQGFHLGYKLTYQKGRIKDNKLRSGYAEFLKLNPQYTAIASQDQPMNALQPTTSVYNIGYDAPSQKWGVDMYITNVAAKKQKIALILNGQVWSNDKKSNIPKQKLYLLQK